MQIELNNACEPKPYRPASSAPCLFPQQHGHMKGLAGQAQRALQPSPGDRPFQKRLACPMARGLAAWWLAEGIQGDLRSPEGIHVEGVGCDI
jgi:hypothetical protein